MKNALGVGLVVALAGCTYQGQSLESYMEEPQKIVQDPHFGDYKSRRDSLESDYLNKKITYAEYQEQLGEIDGKYEAEVKHRNQIIAGEY